MKKLYVQIPWSQDTDRLLECLRYAGFVSDPRDVPGFEGEADRTGFYLRSPKGVVNSVWCEQNAQRMRTFGYSVTIIPQ